MSATRANRFKKHDLIADGVMVVCLAAMAYGLLIALGF